MAFIQQRLDDFCLSTWRFAVLKDQRGVIMILVALALKVKSEIVTEGGEWKGLSEKQPNAHGGLGAAPAETPGSVTDGNKRCSLEEVIE